MWYRKDKPSPHKNVTLAAPVINKTNMPKEKFELKKIHSREKKERFWVEKMYRTSPEEVKK